MLVWQALIIFFRKGGKKVAPDVCKSHEWSEICLANKYSTWLVVLLCLNQLNAFMHIFSTQYCLALSENRHHQKLGVM